MRKWGLRTELCNMLGIERPILLAGMDFGSEATPPELVASVCNAGGMGVVGGSGKEPEELREVIRKVKELTNKPFGVDLLIPVSLVEVDQSRKEAKAMLAKQYPEQWAFVQKLKNEHQLPDVQAEEKSILSPSLIRKQLDIILEEKVAVFVAATGAPAWAVTEMHAQGIKVMAMAGKVRHALRHVEAGVDAVIAQGYEGGGHTGKVATLVLVPQVVDAVAPMPVIAAGGIGDGRGLVAALALGAVGVWCGTAFLASTETGIHPAHQKAILEGQTEDFIITQCYTGKTARQHRNPVTAAWEASKIPTLPMPLQEILMDDFVAAAEKAERWDLVRHAAGQVAGMLRSRKPAAQIMEEMESQAMDIIERQLPKFL